MWPEPDATAAGVRMLQLLKFFIKKGYTVTVASTASKSAIAPDLATLGCSPVEIKMNDSSFDVFVKELKPDLVLFDRFITEEQFGWRVAELVPDALRILDTEDLHSLRHAREECAKKRIPFTINTWKSHDKTKREIASIYRCDLSLIISSFEKDLLTKHLNIDESLLLLLPFMVAPIPKETTFTSYEERKDFIFIGGGKHTPNIDAIKCLHSTIWPLIKHKLPKANLFIYGAYLPQHVLQMHAPKKGFYVKGKTQDAEGSMQKARICLAPLRFGAGIKGKLLQAMQQGTPSITTPIGAEGMHDHLEWNGIVTGDHKAFANAAVALYTDKASWQKYAMNGRLLVNILYNQDCLEKRLHDKITLLHNTLQQHRTVNFIGSLLQHQTQAATKFMGKWIEEKNKNSF